MVSESVGTVMSVKMRWHADFHSNVFMKVHQYYEIRQFEDSKYNLMIRYQFITKVYGDLVKQLCTDLARCCRFRICCRTADISPLPTE